MSSPGNGCLYDDWGNALIGNTFTHNGFFANNTNGDFGEVTDTPGHPANCCSANTDTSGTVTSSWATSSPLQPNDCHKTTILADTNPSFTSQVLCDSQFLGPSQTPCPPGANYPRRQSMVMHQLPSGLATMPSPCAGVPANPWCPARRRHHKRHHHRHKPAHHSNTAPY